MGSQKEKLQKGSVCSNSLAKCLRAHNLPRPQGPSVKSPGTPEPSHHRRGPQAIAAHSSWAEFSVFLLHPSFLCHFFFNIPLVANLGNTPFTLMSSYEAEKRWSKRGKMIRINICKKDFPWIFFFLSTFSSTVSFLLCFVISVKMSFLSFLYLTSFIWLRLSSGLLKRSPSRYLSPLSLIF